MAIIAIKGEIVKLQVEFLENLFKMLCSKSVTGVIMGSLLSRVAKPDRKNKPIICKTVTSLKDIIIAISRAIPIHFFDDDIFFLFNKNNDNSEVV